MFSDRIYLPMQQVSLRDHFYPLAIATLAEPHFLDGTSRNHTFWTTSLPNIFLVQTNITHLVSSKDPEGVDDLLSGVRIHILTSHEVKEGIELDKASGVGVNDGYDTLEVNLTLAVLANGVAQGDQAWLELIRCQPTAPVETDGSLFKGIICFGRYGVLLNPPNSARLQTTLMFQQKNLFRSSIWRAI